MNAIVSLEGVHRRFGKVKALDGLSLTVREGEVYGFLGRNGAGKTTTLRILMGILSADSGTVSVLGQSGRRLPTQLKQRIGYVSQEQHFYPWMTAEQLGRFVAGFYPTWDETEFRRLLKVLDVPYTRRNVELSGGSRTKLGLALALAPRPALLLLDEPTAGLDPVARREFNDLVATTVRDRGTTAFFSSHLVDEVQQIAHRVAIIQAGTARFEGEVATLRASVRKLVLPTPAPIVEVRGGTLLPAPPSGEPPAVSGSGTDGATAPAFGGTASDSAGGNAPSGAAVGGEPANVSGGSAAASAPFFGGAANVDGGASLFGRWAGPCAWQRRYRRSQRAFARSDREQCQREQAGRREREFDQHQRRGRVRRSSGHRRSEPSHRGRQLRRDRFCGLRRGERRQPKRQRSSGRSCGLRRSERSHRERPFSSERSCCHRRSKRRDRFCGLRRGERRQPKRQRSSGRSCGHWRSERSHRERPFSGERSCCHRRSKRRDRERAFSGERSCGHRRSRRRDRERAFRSERFRGLHGERRHRDSRHSGERCRRPGLERSFLHWSSERRSDSCRERDAGVPRWDWRERTQRS